MSNEFITKVLKPSEQYLASYPITIVAAVSKNGVIGNGSDIPWRINGEQKKFKEITADGIVIMGRKTYESIGKPLPNRFNIVVSKHPQYIAPGIQVCSDLETAIMTGVMHGFIDNKKIFIIGGGSIYAEALKYASKAIISRLDIDVEGDIYFPQLDSVWDIVAIEPVKSNINYTVVTYRKHFK